MVSPNSSVALQRQMEIVRRDLNGHADEMIMKARTQLNWRHYVASHPWLSLGTAAGTGYLLARRRTYRKAKAVGPEVVQAAVERAVQASSRSSPLVGVLAGAAGAAAAAVAREGMAFALRAARRRSQRSRDRSEGTPAEGPNERRVRP